MYKYKFDTHNVYIYISWNCFNHVGLQLVIRVNKSLKINSHDMLVQFEVKKFRNSFNSFEIASNK